MHVLIFSILLGYLEDFHRFFLNYSKFDFTYNNINKTRILYAFDLNIGIVMETIYT